MSALFHGIQLNSTDRIIQGTERFTTGPVIISCGRGKKAIPGGETVIGDAGVLRKTIKLGATDTKYMGGF